MPAPDPPLATGSALADRLPLRLRAQAKRANPKLALASSVYADFVEAGGRVEFRDLEPSLLR